MASGVKAERDWARQMARKRRVEIVTNSGRSLGWHTITDREREQWRQIADQDSRWLGLQAAQAAEEEAAQADARRVATEAPEFRETPLPGT